MLFLSGQQARYRAVTMRPSPAPRFSLAAICAAQVGHIDPGVAGRVPGAAHDQRGEPALALLFPAPDAQAGWPTRWLTSSSTQSPLTCLVAAMRRFHALITAIETTSAASCGSL